MNLHVECHLLTPEFDRDVREKGKLHPLADLVTRGSRLSECWLWRTVSLKQKTFLRKKSCSAGIEQSWAEPLSQVTKMKKADCGMLLWDIRVNELFQILILGSKDSFIPSITGNAESDSLQLPTGFHSDDFIVLHPWIQPTSDGKYRAEEKAKFAFALHAEHSAESENEVMCSIPCCSLQLFPSSSVSLQHSLCSSTVCCLS
ncbi:uncharacterized protein PS065_018735 isoform 3-T3 [Dugong dugon]